MKARHHGETVLFKSSAITNIAFNKALDNRTTPKSVGFMLGDLTNNSDNRLPEGEKVIAALKTLGEAMTNETTIKETKIPAAFTYFGQFIDHDITKTAFLEVLNINGVILDPTIKPIKPSELNDFVKNLRTSILDLDSVYGVDASSSIIDSKFKLSKVQNNREDIAKPIKTTDLNHDLPRRAMVKKPATDLDKEIDRQAIIGDPRNDENLIVAQLHVAFLRSHNSLIDRGLNFVEAKTALQRRYQWAVLNDFLKQICDASVIDDVLKNGPQLFKANSKAELFMPIEFSGAAYRFGHSMIRGVYNYNDTFRIGGLTPATFNFLFTFTALSGDLSPNTGHSTQFETLPNNWIIEWHRFFNNENPAMAIDTNLVKALGELRDNQGNIDKTKFSFLASRNLIKGYLLGLPTGQAVARAFKIPILTPNEITTSLSEETRNIMEDADLINRTPLWFYILAEANAQNDGQKLGIVGSRIIAETFWNLAKFAENSVIDNPPSEQELATGEFSLKGIINMGYDETLKNKHPLF